MACTQCVLGNIGNDEDLIKEERKLITCILNELGIKYMVIDNGIKYEALYYVEINGEKAKGVYEQFIKCIEEALSNSKNDSRGKIKPVTKVFDDSYVIMFNKEYVTIRVTWE